MEAIEKVLQHLRTPNGLYSIVGIPLCTVRGETLRVVTTRGQSFKLHYSHYDLMWRVHQDATRELIEAMRPGHVLDWSNLHFDRIASTTNLEEPLVWSKRLAKGFVDSKRPNMGIGAGLYNDLPPRQRLGAT